MELFLNNTEQEEVLNDMDINLNGYLLDPRLDYVFKRIFISETHESKIALIDFLNSIIDLDEANKIVDLTVLTPEQPVESKTQKKAKWDLRVRFHNDEQAAVEMEFRKKDDYVKRSIHEISRIYSMQQISGKNYSQLKKCYLVSIMGYNLLGKDFGYLRNS